MTTVVSSLMSGDFNINKEATSTVLEEGDSNKKIAEIVVEGEIIDTGASGGLFGGGTGYNHQAALKQLETIKNDDSIKGVLLSVNSPGGGTYESDEFYQKIKEVKDSGKRFLSKWKI